MGGKKILEDTQNIYNQPYPPPDCVIGNAHCKSQKQAITAAATGLGQWAGFSIRLAAHHSTVNSSFSHQDPAVQQ